MNNGITGDTRRPDDINLSIRGIGTLETIAAIDGHPIGYGIKGGYNYQLSPVYPYRNISVLYGSGGSDLVGVNAIGGVVNFQTLDRTPHDTATFTQGYGTFEQLSTRILPNRDDGHLGSPSQRRRQRRRSAAQRDDVSNGRSLRPIGAVGPGLHLGVYADDSLAVTRADLVKLQYNFNSHTSLTLTSVGQNSGSTRPVTAMATIWITRPP